MSITDILERTEESLAPFLVGQKAILDGETWPTGMKGDEHPDLPAPAGEYPITGVMVGSAPGDIGIELGGWWYGIAPGRVAVDDEEYDE